MVHGVAINMIGITLGWRICMCNCDAGKEGYLWKLETEKCMCGDSRLVNKKTKSDRYPTPIPKELFDVVGKAWIFSMLDLRSGYHQLPLRVEDRMKTAFWGVDEDGKDSLFHWKFLLFGLKNAPAEFQRVMDQVLKGLPFARCYIDDVIIFSDLLAEHVRHLQHVFERLRAWGLRLHHGKYKFFYYKLAYLGHIILPGDWKCRWQGGSFEQNSYS